MTARRSLPGIAVLLGAWLALAAAVPMLLDVPIARAASCSGASHDAPVLSSPTASPMTGSPATTITFHVRYRDAAGCVPTAIAAVVTGVGTFPMTLVTGTPTAGALYVTSTKLPVGSWAFGFQASSGSGAGARSTMLAGPGKIRITATSPKPTPQPTPRPTPRPTPKPTPRPKPTTKPSSGGSKPSAKPSAKPSGSSSGSGGPSGPSVGASEPGGGIIVVPPSSDGGSGTPGSDGDRGSGLDVGRDGGFVLAGALVLASSGALVFAVGHRRRRRSPSVAPTTDPVIPAPLAPAAPSAAPAAIAEPGWTPAFVTAPPTPVAVRDAGPPQNTPAENRPPARFEHPAKHGAVRGTIAYRHVRVSAEPDDIRSAELGRLERRDEVEVIGESGGYFQIRTPSGIVGWVPRVVFLGSAGVE